MNIVKKHALFIQLFIILKKKNIYIYILKWLLFIISKYHFNQACVYIHPLIK